MGGWGGAGQGPGGEVLWGERGLISILPKLMSSEQGALWDFLHAVHAAHAYSPPTLQELCERVIPAQRLPSACLIGSC